MKADPKPDRTSSRTSTIPNQTTILEDAAERGGVYALLSQLWDGYLNPVVLDWLTDKKVATALPAWFDIPQPDSLVSLRDDYTQLFVGPKNHLPPYQSVWQFGRFEAAPAQTMRTYIEVTGYCPDRIFSYGGRNWKRYPNEDVARMTDHIAVQLNLMSHVLLEVAVTPAARLEMHDLVASFFDDCLCWCTPLITAVGNRANTDFYAGVARLTGEFLADESGRFGHLG